MNPFLEKMGFTGTDKVLISHIDDIGFCHAANVAAFECLDLGAASCGSVIVNAPWFSETARICRERPGYDMGVHLTLTCEWDSYRWPALSSRDPASGLLDAEGYLWRTSREAVKNITVEVATGEMRRQLETALAAGIDVTHIDTHMGSVVHPRFLLAYLQLAQEYGVPAFLPNITRQQLAQVSDPESVDEYEAILTRIETSAVPTLDNIIIDTLHAQTDKLAYYKTLISEIKPGLTHLLFHPARLGDELSAITPESATWRHDDYLCFSDPGLKDFIESADLTLIGYRELRAWL